MDRRGVDSAGLCGSDMAEGLQNQPPPYLDFAALADYLL
jgi:hypothetical protein